MEGRALVTECAKKEELLNGFLALVFTGKTSPQESLTQEIRVKGCWKKDLVKEDWNREHLGKIKIHKSMVPDGTHS